jgi:hypothetical protein
MRAASSPAGLLLGMLLLSACADTGARDFDGRMATYVAGPEVQLVSGLGVPQQIYETDGRRFLRYDFAGQTSAPSISPGIGLGFGSGGWGRGGGIGTGIGLGFGGGGAYQSVSCTVTFEIKDNRVLNFERRGDSCR